METAPFMFLVTAATRAFVRSVPPQIPSYFLVNPVTTAFRQRSLHVAGLDECVESDVGIANCFSEERPVQLAQPRCVAYPIAQPVRGTIFK